MTIFAMAASARKDSLNKKLIAQAVPLLQKGGATVDHADFREFAMPVYDGDIETSSGVPEGAKNLATRLAAADGIVLSTPEYNGGIPGALKNAIDWVSRTSPSPFSGKPLLLLGASPGALGAVRSLWHTRVPFEVLGALVLPEMFGLPHANQAFDSSGALVDGKNRERLEKLVATFIRYVRAVAG